ncbi:FtsB family cell division protein [Novosphingobium ginsenosidimutans]|uniref:Septum formation initiator n=1 Tax=Novosphingobium ginsenosidimutans TaxID=1176536 RepID=A0A5B8S7W8_9SPHN|nr:septum formation initiator family protein [Novosphingobium ginsenosidimutans]QEA16777.1 septum formation initiator [Novosphingobium ginsenosidimutans]
MGGRNEPNIISQNLRQASPLFALLFLLGLALAGPSGILAWSEYNRTLAEKHAQLEKLKAERDVLKNRVALLNPDNVDPDMAGELLRKDLNVVHPDEMVILLN